MFRTRRRRTASPSGRAGDEVPERDGIDGSLATADALADAARYSDAITLLTRANRRRRDVRLEQRLVDLRADAFPHLGVQATPAGGPTEVPDRFPGAQIPEVPAAELSVGALHSAIRHHGSLVVRGLVDRPRVDRLVTAIDHAIAAYDALGDAETPAELTGWYTRFERDQVSDRARKRFRGAVMTVESPPTLFQLLDTFDAAGISPLVREYFGEPPALLARKGILRRMSHEGTTGGWHQDGAFMGTDIRSLNVWLSLSHCGDDAPGIDVVARRLDELVKTGDGAFTAWATDPEAAERVAAGATVRPIFEPGDALIFDHMNLHRTAIDPGMSRDRYAIETWLLAPSTYGAMTADVVDGYSPRDQIPLVL